MRVKRESSRVDIGQDQIRRTHMFVRRLPDLRRPRVLTRLPGVLGAAALVAVLGYAPPSYSAASPACFNVCSNLCYKNISAVLKCALKETVKAGTGTPCAMKAASKMSTNYDIKLQAKCAGDTCVASYPSTSGHSGCLDLLGGAAIAFSNGGADPVTVAAIDQVAFAGCAY
jgi:hypothetical protein